MESPKSKKQYLDFQSYFKEVQSESNEVSQVIKQVLSNVFDFSSKIHWKILTDIAEFSKKEGMFEDAWILYKIVTWI